MVVPSEKCSGFEHLRRHPSFVPPLRVVCLQKSSHILLEDIKRMEKHPNSVVIDGEGTSKFSPMKRMRGEATIARSTQFDTKCRAFEI